MAELAAGLLPHAVARMGQREPVSVHLVLTGPGGGTWDVAVGTDQAVMPGRAGESAVSIVADAVGFLPPWWQTGPDQPSSVRTFTGDSRRIAGILTAASSLALD